VTVITTEYSWRPDKRSGSTKRQPSGWSAYVYKFYIRTGSSLPSAMLRSLPSASPHHTCHNRFCIVARLSAKPNNPVFAMALSATGRRTCKDRKPL
jgi:hypothetical protein